MTPEDLFVGLQLEAAELDCGGVNDRSARMNNPRMTRLQYGDSTKRMLIRDK